MSDFIDIIIPLYNRQDLVGETLQSLLNQSYPNWHAYVVDDGSTDGSKEVAHKYAEQSNGRIQVVDRPDYHKPGGSGARNYGASLSKADWIIFLDSDDLLDKEALSIRAKYIANYREMDLIVFPTAVFQAQLGDSNKILGRLHSKNADLDRFLKFDIPWITAGPVWKRSSFLSIGGFIEMARTQQDWEVHTRALLEGLNVYKVEDTVVNRHYYYRMPVNRESISVRRLDPELVENKLTVYEKVRKKYASKYPYINSYFLRKYFLDYVELIDLNRREDADIYKETAYSLGTLSIVLWNLNFFFRSIAKWELQLLERVPIPKIINRLYNWRYMKRVFFQKNRYIG